VIQHFTFKNDFIPMTPNLTYHQNLDSNVNNDNNNNNIILYKMWIDIEWKSWDEGRDRRVWLCMWMDEDAYKLKRASEVDLWAGL